MTKKLSLADLNARKASETPYKFQPLGPTGEPMEITLSVLGSQSYTVQKAINAAVDARRKQEAIRDAELGTARPGDNITPLEDDVKFGQRLAAARLVGWDGIEEPFTPENALTLCQDNPDLADQITKQSNRLANFMKASPKG